MKKQFTVASLICTTLILGACGSNNDIEYDLSGGDVPAELLEDLELGQNMMAEINGVDKLPSWAKKLGLDEPKGMTLNKVRSIATSEKEHGYNSVTLSYTGDYDTAMKEAERIAKAANIPASSDFTSALDVLDSMGDMGVEMDPADLEAMNTENMGMIYTNFSIFDYDATKDGQYQISITVGSDGSLDISATDYEKMMNAATADGYINWDN